jgi:hypothetical protein
MAVKSVLFVYAVDGGLLSMLKDYAHKIVSPKTYLCKLCSLTYGPLGKAPAWSKLLRDLPVEAKFLHRNEVRRNGLGNAELPAVFVEHADGSHQELIAAREINACTTIDELVALVRTRIEPLAAR